MSEPQTPTRPPPPIPATGTAVVPPPYSTGGYYYPPLPPSGGSPGPRTGRLSPALLAGILLAGFFVIAGGGALVYELSSSPNGGTSALVSPAISLPSPTVPLTTVPLTTVPLPSGAPATTPPTTTTVSIPMITPPTTPPAPNSIVVGDGVTVTPASGWSVTKTKTDNLQLVSDSGAVAFFFAGSAGTRTADQILGEALNTFTTGMTNVQTSPPQPIQFSSGSGIAGLLEDFSGVLAGQQGSVDIRGSIAVAVRASDGLFAGVQQGDRTGAWSADTTDLAAMDTSFFDSLAAAPRLVGSG